MEDNIFDPTIDSLPGDFTEVIVEPSSEVSLDVDLMSVTENSGKSFKYTFTRTADDISNPLTVNFSIGGEATLNTDYTQTGAVINGTEYTVTIPANATTADVTITPKADSEIESDEAVKLTLKEGNEYILDNNSQLFGVAKLGNSEASSMDDNAVMAVIANDDAMFDAAWMQKFDDKGNGYGYEYLAVDDAGNTYATGNFWTLAPASVDGENITATGEYDTFVAKIDKDGKVEWAKNFGGSDNGSDNTRAKDIAADSSGTYLTGTFRDEVIFGDDTLTGGGNGYNDVYVAKLDTTGKAVWAKSFGRASNAEEASGIEVDAEGNTFIIGDFEGQLEFGDTTLDGSQSRDVYVAKLDSKGDVLWAGEYNSSFYSDKAGDVVVDKEGNAYVLMGEGNESGGNTPSVIKLNKSDGSQAWKENFGNENSYIVAEDIAIDNQDNIFIAGEFKDSITFDSIALEGGENGDVFVAKLDSSNDGKVLWAVDFDSGEDDGVEVEGIAVDDEGNTYVSGYYRGESMNVDDFMLYEEYSNDKSWDTNAFLTKFDSDGKVKWAQNIGGANRDEINDIAVKDGNIYLAGKFETEATFGDKTLTADKYEINSSIDNSRFLVKLEKEKPEISLAVDSNKVTEGDNKTITYTFTRTGDMVAALTVDFSVSGSATFNDDYTLAGADDGFDGSKGKVTFKAGESTAKVTLNISDDSDGEEDETLALQLVDGSGYMVSTTDVATNTITITSDEKVIGIDDVEFSLVSNTKQTFKFKSNFTSGKSSIKFSFKSKSINEFKEIAIVTVDDDEGTINGLSSGDEGYIEAALNRAKSLFSLLGNTPQGFGDIDIEKVLEFSSETRFRFLSVNGGTLQGVKKGTLDKSQVTLSSSDFLQISESENNSFDLNFEGVEIKMKFDAKAKKAIGSGLQDRIEALDLREVTTTQTATFTVNREAEFDNTIGFYKVIDEDGGIDTNGDGTADILVGDAGYAQAAVQNRIANIDLSVENQATAEFTGELEAGAIIVPFLIVNGSADAFEEIYFSFIGANADGVDHVMMLGDNIFGFEDLPGGGDRDFNDVIASVEIG